MIPGEGVRIDVAFATAPEDPAPAYVDVTDRVLMSPGISVTRGRSPEGGVVSTGTCSLTLDNDDGRFTAENPASPYYPNVKLARRLQVTRRNPETLGRFNMLPAVTADVEDGLLTNWFNNYFGAAAASTITNDTTRAFSGTRSVKVVWPTTAGGVGAGVFMPANLLRTGRTYVASARVFVPAGSPAVSFGDTFGSTPNATSTAVDRWQILRVAFVATQHTIYFSVRAASATTAGQAVWVDAVQIDEAEPGRYPATSVDSGRLNLCTNPNLTVNTTGWLTFGTALTRDLTPDPRGRIAPDGVTATPHVRFVVTGLTAGETLALSAEVAAASTAGSNLTIGWYVDFRDGGGTVVVGADSGPQPNPLVLAPSATGTLANTPTVPVGAVQATVYLRYPYTPPAAHVVFFDHVLAGSAGAFFDGSTADTASTINVWAASPNLSISQQFADTYSTEDPFADGGPVKHRFTGYVDDWPVSWPSGPAIAYASIVASDRQKRLAGRQDLRSVVAEEYLLDDPRAYFPLGEAEGSTTAGDVSAAGYSSPLSIKQYGAGGSIDFGAGTGPGTDSQSAAVFAPVSASAGRSLVATAVGSSSYNTYFFGGDPVSLEAVIATTTNGRRIVSLSSSWGWFVALGVDATGKLEVSVANPWRSTSTLSVASATTVADGETHHVAATMTATTATLYRDGVNVGTLDVTALWTGGLGAFEALEVGGAAAMLYAGTLSHVGVFNGALSAARVAAHAAACLTGFAGERSDQRVARLLDYAGVPAVDRVLDVGLSTNIDHVDTTGATALAVAQRVGETENGLVLVDRRGRVAFHGRGRRYNAPVAVELDSTNVRPLTSGLSYNDQDLANDVTAKRQNGYSVRVLDAASVEDNGRATGDLDLVTGSDAEVEAAAAWRVATRATPAVKFPGVVVDLLDNDVLLDQLLELEISDRVVIGDLLSQVGSSELDLFVEGYTETISDTAWDLALNTSRVSLAGRVWTIEDPEFGAVDAGNRVAY